MKKIALILVAVLLLACLFTACSATGTTTVEASTSASVAATQEAPSAGEASAAQPAETSNANLKDKYLIGISQMWGTVAYCQTIVQGAKDSGKEWADKLGVDIEFAVTDAGLTDTSNQVKDLEDLSSQQVDGLLLFPGDSTIVSEPLQSIYNANNIPVVITDIGVTKGEYLSFIITDNTAGGKMAADAMGDLLPDRGDVVIFQNAPGSINAQQRAKGFTDEAEALGFKSLGEKQLDLTVESGKQLMEDILTSNPDIAGVFTISTETAIGAASALADAGNTKCKIVCFDVNKTAYDMIKDGSIGAAIVQDPYYMGYEGLNQLMYYFTGETDKIVKDIGASTSVIIKDNVDEFADNPQVQ